MHAYTAKNTKKTPVQEEEVIEGTLNKTSLHLPAEDTDERGPINILREGDPQF